MLETVVSTILSRYLGQFIKGFESENLKLNILSGRVVLENLELKTEALEALELPIEVKRGFLGKLHLDIPWSSLSSKPVIATVERVFLLAVPKTGAQDSDAQERRDQATKQKRLQLAEMLKSSPEDGSPPKSKDQEDSFVNKLVTKVIDNLQIFVDKVHIRYEDDSCNPKNPFSVGITLEKLHVESTDGNWKPKFLHEKSNLVHKLVSLKNFAVYWNTIPTFLDFNTTEDLAKLLDQLLFDHSHHHYLVQPINGMIKAILSKDDTNFTRPKITASLLLEHVGLNLEQQQYIDILALMDTANSYVKGLPYRKWRPMGIPVHQNPRAWWNFAISAVVSETKWKKERWSWEYISKRRKDRIDYMGLHKRSLKKKLDADQKTQLEQMEARLSYEDIVLFRSLAEASYKLDLVKEKEEKSKKSWIGRLFGGSSKVDEDASSFTPEAWKELYKTIDYSEDNAPTKNVEVPKEWVQMLFDFHLRSGSFTLRNSDQNCSPILNLSFQELALNVQKRDDSATVQIDLSSVKVLDHHSVPGKILDLVAENYDIHRTKYSNAKVLSITLDQNPLDKRADLAVKVEGLQPLTVTLAKPLIDRSAKFFSEHKSQSIEDIQKAAAVSYETLKDQAQTQIKYAIGSKKTLEVNVDFLAPTIIIPEDFENNECNALVMDLGRLKLVSDLKAKSTAVSVSESQDPTVTKDYFYDQYNLSISNLRALVIRKSRIGDPESQEAAKIIDNFDINFRLGVCSFDAIDLPKVRFHGKLPSLKFNVSSDKCVSILKVLMKLGQETSDSVVRSAPVLQTVHTPSYYPSSSLGGLESMFDHQTPKQKKKKKKKRVQVLDDEGNVEEETYVVEYEHDNGDEVPKVNKKLIEMSFKIEEISASLRTKISQGASHDQEILSIRIDSVLASAELSDFDRRVKVGLKSFVIEDLVQTWGPDFGQLISTRPQSGSEITEFLEINYVGIPVASPTYRNVDHAITANFNVLDIGVNLEVLAILLEFSKQLTGALGPSPDQQPTVKVENADEEKKEKKPIALATLLDLKLVVKEVRMSLNRGNREKKEEGERLALIAVSEFHLDARVKTTNEVALSGTLGDIQVKSPLYSPWSDILRVERSGDAMIEFGVETINPRKKNPYGQLKIRAGINSVRAVFVAKFLKELQGYLNEFTSMQTLLLSTAASVKEAAEAQAKDIKSIIKLDVTIRNPIALIPASSSSGDKYLIADLGLITLKNDQKEMPDGVLIDEIHVCVSQLNLKSAVVEQDKKRKQYIIRDIEVNAKVKRPLVDTEAYPPLDLAASIKEIGVSITEGQIDLLLSILSGNLSENPTVQNAQLAHMRDSIRHKDKDGNNKRVKSRELVQSPKPAPRETNDAPARPTMNLTVSLHKLELNVAKGDGVDALDVSTSIASFDMLKIDASINMFSDSSIDMLVGLGSIEFYDNRHETKNYWKKILSKHESARREGFATDKLFTMKYKKLPSGQQIVAMEIFCPEVNFVFDVIWELKIFGLTALDRFLKSLDVFSRASADYAKISSGDTSIPLPPPPPEDLTDPNYVPPSSIMTVTISVHALEMRLIGDTTDESSQGFVLNNSVNIIYEQKGQSQSVSINVTDVELYKSKIKDREKTVDLMKPFKLKMDFLMQPDAQKGELLMENIELFVSYSDFKLVMNIVDSTNKMFQSFVEPPSSQPAAITEQPSGSSDNPQPVDPAQISQRFVIRTGFVSLSVIDDCFSGDTSTTFGRQLLRTVLTSMAADASAWSSEPHGSLVLKDMKVDYLNQELELWEPVVESWDLGLKVLTEKEPPVMKAIISTMDPMQMNISKAFLSTLFQCIDTWKDDYYKDKKQSSESRSTSFCPYYIVNGTGVDIEISIYEDSKKEPIKILNGEQFGIDSLEIESRMRKKIMNDEPQDRTYDKLELHVKVNFKDLPVRLNNLPLHDVGTKRINLSRRHPEKYLIYEVAHRYSSKVCTLRSFVQIETTLQSSCRLLFQGPNLDDIEVILKGNSKVPVPIQYIGTGRISLRPLDNDTYEWSPPISLTRKIDKEFLDSFACNSKAENNPPYIFLTKVAIQKKLSTYDPDSFLISIYSPTIIENLLPNDVKVHVIDDSKNDIVSKDSTLLPRGAKLPVYYYNNKPAKISVSIPEFNDDAWSTSKKIPKSGSVEKLTLTDPVTDNDILINIESFLEPNLQNVISLSAPYWLINKTRLPILYKPPLVNKLAAGMRTFQKKHVGEGIDLEQDPSEWYKVERPERALPFLYSPMQLCLSLANEPHVWSKEFSVSTRGSAVVKLGCESKPIEFNFVVYNGRAPEEYLRTFMVTIQPYFFIVNKTEKKIFYSQVDEDTEYVLDPNAQLPFHWMNGKGNHQLQIRFQNSERSTAFRIDEVLKFDLKMYDKETKETNLSLVDIQFKDESLYIIFSEKTREYADYRIDNQSPLALVIVQTGAPFGKPLKLKPYTCKPYAWDDPFAELKEINVLVRNKSYPPKRIKFDKFKKYGEHHYDEKTTLSMEVLAEGPSKVLLITDRPHYSTPNLPSLMPLAPTGAATGTYSVEANFAGISISIIDDTPQELMLVTVKDLRVRAESNHNENSLEVKLRKLQVDNQLYLTPCSIVLYVPPTEKEDSEFFHLSLVQSKKYKSIIYFNYFGLMLQALELNVDELFMLKSLKFVENILNFLNKSFAINTAYDVFNPPPNKPLSDQEGSPQTMLYFELLHINPIKVTITFISMHITKSPNEQTTPLEKLLRAAGAFANIDMAPINLNCLMLKHPFCTPDELVQRLVHHYSNQVLRQVLFILGSADFLGSPVSLVHNLGTGVFDFFYEPAHGFISSPADFRAGLVKGTSSLVKKSVYGIFNTASKLTGTVTSAAVNASFDEDWKRERAIAAINKPQHVGEGIALGMKDFGMGVFRGITGVVAEPVKGGQKEGAVGVIKGFGKGMTGLILKPTVGMVDLVTRTTEGIKNTTTFFDAKRTRERPPRYFGPQRVLQPFSQEEAKGQEILNTLENGKFANEQYIYYTPNNSDHIILLSDQNFFYVEGIIESSKFKLKWNENINDVQEIQPEKEAIIIAGRGKKDLRKIPVVTNMLTIQVKRDLDKAISEIRNNQEIFHNYYKYTEDLQPDLDEHAPVINNEGLRNPERRSNINAAEELSREQKKAQIEHEVLVLTSTDEISISEEYHEKTPLLDRNNSGSSGGSVPANTNHLPVVQAADPSCCSCSSCAIL